MAFKRNPLSITFPEPAFESWLRDSGYLEILDQRTSDLHRLNTTAITDADANPSTIATSSTAITPAITSSIFYGLFSYIGTLIYLFTLNPFSKLTTDDFLGETTSWTAGFVGSCDSYSFPASSVQARLRVHENVKRFARNYSILFIVGFACALYQMPLALLGLMSSLALLDLFRIVTDKWGKEQYPVLSQVLLRTGQCATVVILFWSNVQMALFCSIGIGYAGMILHASIRKLTPTKLPSRQRSRRS